MHEPLEEHSVEFFTAGCDAAGDFTAYVNLLDAEYHHPDLRPALRALALKGLKSSTGHDVEGLLALANTWCERCCRVRDSGDRLAYAQLLDEQDMWLSLLDRFSRYLDLASRQGRSVGGDERANHDAAELFDRKGREVIRGCRAWYEDLAPGAAEAAHDDASFVPSMAGTLTSGAPGGPAIDAVSITKRYGDLVAVDAVSIHVQPGEVFGLLGPNGAGKTTFIECLEGIREPDSGVVRILGLRYRTDGKQIRTRIGVQLQSTGFYSELTCKETLQFYASFFPRPLSSGDLLERLGLTEKSKTLVRNLSGGMRQRLALGMALIGAPEVLFLDEPTTGLDPQARHDIWDLIRGVQHNGCAVLLTTHYMEEAEFLCDRVAIMNSGVVRALGSPAELIRSHLGSRTIEAEFADEIPVGLESKIAGADRSWVSGRRLTISTTDPRATMASLLSLPEETVDITMRSGNLEDVFLQVAGERLK